MLRTETDFSDGPPPSGNRALTAQHAVLLWAEQRRPAIERECQLRLRNRVLAEEAADRVLDRVVRQGVRLAELTPELRWGRVRFLVGSICRDLRQLHRVRRWRRWTASLTRLPSQTPVGLDSTREGI